MAKEGDGFMNSIKQVIKHWLEDWNECVTCNHMYKNSLLLSTNEDKLICIDCIADEPSYGQA